MFGNFYEFTRKSSCCSCESREKRPKCPGFCGIFTEIIPWFEISGTPLQAIQTSNLNQTKDLNQSEGIIQIFNSLVNPVTEKDRMDEVQYIPYLCCSYFFCCSCTEAQIFLHGQNKITSPFYGCRGYHLISSNDKFFGTIKEAGCLCCLRFEILDETGNLIQTVKKEESCFGHNWIGKDNENNVTSVYNYFKSCCLFGDTGISVKFETQDQTARTLGLALVPYL